MTTGDPSLGETARLSPSVSSSAAVMTSPDCENWIGRSIELASSVTSAYLNSVAYGGGLFVAVGYQYDSSISVPLLATSTDGFTWTDLSESLPEGATGSLSESCTATVVCCSRLEHSALHSDVHGWIELAWQSAIPFYPMGMTYHDGQYVIGANLQEMVPGLWTSSDAVTWTLRHAINGPASRGMAWGDGRFGRRRRSRFRHDVAQRRDVVGGHAGLVQLAAWSGLQPEPRSIRGRGIIFDDLHEWRRRADRRRRRQRRGGRHVVVPGRSVLDERWDDHGRLRHVERNGWSRLGLHRANGTLTFLPSSSHVQTISVPTLTDAAIEGDETLT